MVWSKGRREPRPREPYQHYEGLKVGDIIFIVKQHRPSIFGGYSMKDEKGGGVDL